MGGGVEVELVGPNGRKACAASYAARTRVRRQPAQVQPVAHSRSTGLNYEWRSIAIAGSALHTPLQPLFQPALFSGARGTTAATAAAATVSLAATSGSAAGRRRQGAAAAGCKLPRSARRTAEPHTERKVYLIPMIFFDG